MELQDVVCSINLVEIVHDFKLSWYWLLFLNFHFGQFCGKEMINGDHDDGWQKREELTRAVI